MRRNFRLEWHLSLYPNYNSKIFQKTNDEKVWYDYSKYGDSKYENSKYEGFKKIFADHATQCNRTECNVHKRMPTLKWTKSKDRKWCKNEWAKKYRTGKTSR